MKPLSPGAVLLHVGERTLYRKIETHGLQIVGKS